MRFFDLHCDTLYRAVTEKKTLFEPSFQLSLDRGKNFSQWIQCMAVWLPDGLSSDSARALFQKARKQLYSELNDNNLTLITDKKSILAPTSPAVMLTVENGALIDGNIEIIDILADAGVKALTLTWNGANAIGDGAEVRFPKGLTKFGKKAVKKLEERGIVIDISHASDPLFYDVASLAEKPFIATHSNSRACTGHKRNLTDEQFEVIKDAGGIVGINFCDMFLNAIPQNACITDIIRHTEHFLSLGGKDVLSFGSDFDGCDVAADVASIDGVSRIYDEFLKLNYSENLLDKLFFANAYNFFFNYFDISQDIL